ncbi:MAG TPA: fibronectin type III domain-containing protein [Polyangiaceae bacterium]|nr:fibronectin type III domain-containing protein [Polyangiaceae bacterium]
MKPARVFTVKGTLVVVLALVAVDGCNVILGNESHELDLGSGGRAGTAMGGRSGESTTAEAGQAEAGQAGVGQAGASNSGSDGAALGGAPDGTAGENSGTGGQTETPTTPLLAPTGVAFTPTSETEGTITWQLVDQATSYTVEIATDTGFMDNRRSVSETGTSTKVSGLKADTLYQVRVRANGSHDRMSAWSTASGTTLLNPPTELKLDLYVSPQGTAVGYSGLLWIENPDDLKNGGAGQKWHYARGTASAKCAAGTTVQYQFDANYDSDARKGYTGFGTTNEAYIVRPTGRVTFYVKARCVGPNNPSKATSEISACRRSDDSGC